LSSVSLECVAHLDDQVRLKPNDNFIFRSTGGLGRSSAPLRYALACLTNTLTTSNLALVCVVGLALTNELIETSNNASLPVAPDEVELLRAEVAELRSKIEQMQQTISIGTKEHIDPNRPSGVTTVQPRKRILVTGGAGFVGSHLVDRLLDSGAEVIALDNFVTGQSRNLRHQLSNTRLELVRQNVEQPLFFDVDQIYHLGKCLTSEKCYCSAVIDTHDSPFHLESESGFSSAVHERSGAHFAYERDRYVKCAQFGRTYQCSRSAGLH
jgi:hypothetical protein